MKVRLSSWTYCVAVLVLHTQTVLAQSSEFDTELFLPTAGVGTTFTLDSATVPKHLSYVLGLGLNASARPFIRGDIEESIVAWRGQGEFLAALGLFGQFELGIAVPVVVGHVADDPLADTLVHSTHVGAGDVRLSVKAPLITGRAFRLAARTVATLPTGDGAKFLGSDYWTLVPSAVVSYPVGQFMLGGEVGYWFRRGRALADLELDDEVLLKAGASRPLGGSLSAVGEIQARLGVGGESFRSNELPLEVDLGLRAEVLGGLVVDVGAGTGLQSGYGVPIVRGFVVTRYQSEREPCVWGPEDFDGYLDGDYCRDPDNDGDGIDDDRDECPNDAEDLDGFLDADGCPDVDDDADGVLDESDQCPRASEDQDGYEDQDGCPDLDNDEDGIADGFDQCPMEGEDLDEFEDEDGCPEPGPEHVTVTITDTRILISERIYFDFDQDTIRQVSLPLLDKVAAVIRDLPSSKGVRVEGYSDSAGDAHYNVDLSYRRARAVVMYLASQGVERRRLQYVGYGPKNPVAPNDSPAGRALNRRVEFTILEVPESRQKRRSSRRR